MAPGAHLLISWLSTVNVLKKARERRLVTLTGVAPDIDGIGIIIDKLTGTTEFYVKYHHYLAHNILAALVFATIAAFFAKTQKFTVWILSFIVVHLHILCDIIGSRGSDGYQWPIYYFYPFNKSFVLTWSGQWELNSWQNQLILSLLILISIYYGLNKKITFFEIFSKRLNAVAIKMLNRYVNKKN